jgi:hypothetical protein
MASTVGFHPVVEAPVPDRWAWRGVELGFLVAAGLAVLVLVAHAWAGAGPVADGTRVTVTSADVPDWPFTVPAGDLVCDNEGASSDGASGWGDDAVTFEAGGVRYALNDVARRRHLGVDVAPVLLPSADLEGVVQEGLRLCP